MPDSYSAHGGTDPDTSLSKLFARLETPDSSDSVQAIDTLRDNLQLLDRSHPTLEQQEHVLDKLYARGTTTLEKLIPALVGIPVPAPRKSRQLIRTIQEVLGALSEQLMGLYERCDRTRWPLSHSTPDVVLWRILRILSRHLLIGNLTASQPGNGVWRTLHKTYDLARLHTVTRNVPKEAPRSLQDEYYAAVLLGCAQPASFTAREILFLDAYLERYSSQIDSNRDKTGQNPEMFWIDPARDAPATPCSRKPPPQDTSVRFFSCGRLADQLANQIAALDAGRSPLQLGLPDFAATPAGRGVMQRLCSRWGDPAKRRFPRRRQNYRAHLCVGLMNVFQLFQTSSAPSEVSNWMVVNESPDGYAIMHVSGKAGAITVGDVVALRTETGNNWQLCIIRWMLSENPEHIELGLQILSARAIAAQIAVRSDTQENSCLPALILPATPTLRPEESLVVQSGTLNGRSRNLVLIIEKDNIEVREVNTVQLGEQNGQIEIYEIETDPGES